MCDPMVFPYTSAEEIIEAVKANGGPTLTDAPTGAINHDGVYLGYVVADGNISFTVQKKPFYVSCEMIEGELKNFFKGIKAPEPVVEAEPIPAIEKLSTQEEKSA